MITIENLYEGRNGRALAWALYVVCGLFLFSPALDVMSSVMPPQLRSIQWRFGLLVSMAPTIMTGVISLAMFAVLGVLFGHRVVLRTVGVVSVILGVSYILGLGVLGLDLLQLRNAVPPDRRLPFWITSLKSLLQFLIGGGSLLLLGLGSLRVTKIRRGVTEGDAGKRPRAPTLLGTRAASDGGQPASRSPVALPDGNEGR